MKQKFPSIKIITTPNFILNILQPIGTKLIVKHLQQKISLTIAQIHYHNQQLNIDPKSLPYYQKLYNFQKQCIQFAIKKRGRLLIADQMGIGKTVQALAIANLYIYQWPLLIITPSSLVQKFYKKFNWKDQVLFWYSDLKKLFIQIILKSKEDIRTYAKVVIVSYDMAVKKIEELERFKIAIVDEAHYLKGLETKRSQNLIPLLKKKQRIILLSGTPAFARPKQLFNLLSIIRPDIFINFRQFGQRYCDPKKSKFSHRLQYLGSTNTKELHYILKNNLMIRRLKQQVLHQLPKKQRQKIILQTDNKIVNQIKNIMNGIDNQKLQSIINSLIVENNQFPIITNNNNLSNYKQTFMHAYKLGAKAKLQNTLVYIQQLIANDCKLLVFAHHLQILDNILKKMIQNKIQYIRIDGKVIPEQRNKRVKLFQQNYNIRIAILSITAAGTGFTMAASSTVIFVQMHFTPALMIQAQDRAHRIGQKCSVNCHYLIGLGTLDQFIYKKLSVKMVIVSSVLDGINRKLQAQNKTVGQKGLISQTSYSEFYVKKKLKTLQQYFFQIDSKGIIESSIRH